jgi:NarL family two-component system response regulator LiaR
MSVSIRVLIVDDHQIVRKGIRGLLGTEADLEVVGEAKDGFEAISKAATLKPEVVLMDLEMPGMDGIEAIRRIKEHPPEVQILVLTSFATDDKVFPAIKAGALGYLLKDSSPKELIAAIRDVHRGEPSLHPTIAKMLLEEISAPPQKPPTKDPLTDRELEVLELVAGGLSNQQIADKLVISESTVKTHVNHILGKLHLASRTQAALYALRAGLASLDKEESEGDR